MASIPVSMLVRNSAVTDTRVRKEAVALARLGYDVEVLALADEISPLVEHLEGAVIRRMAYVSRLRKRRELYLAEQALVKRSYKLRLRVVKQRGVLASAIYKYASAEVERRLLPPRLTSDEEDGQGAEPLAVEPPLGIDEAAAVLGAQGSRQPEIALMERSLGTMPSLQSPVSLPDPTSLGEGSPEGTARMKQDGSPSPSASSPWRFLLPATYRRAVGWRLARLLRRVMRGVHHGHARQVQKAREQARTRYLQRHAHVQRRWESRKDRLGWVQLALDHWDYWKSVEMHLLARRPRVVHAHDVNTLFAAWMYCRRHNSILIYDAHELELHRNTTWTLPRRLITWIVEVLGARSASGVITVSEGIARELRRIHRIPLPTVVLNSPDIRDAVPPGDPARPGIRALAGLGPTDRIIVYVGKVARGRGVESLVSVLTMLDADFHVVVLGPRDKRADALLIGLAEELGVVSRLHLVPPIPASDVPSALRDADVFVNPAHNVCKSYDLALPNKLFDALFAGLPVIVGKLREMKEFVTANEIGLVYDEEDVPSLAQAIRALVALTPAGVVDEKRLARLQNSVSWERQVTKLSSLYARAAATGNVGALR